jgi:cleavage stimulation factor subunit 3
MAELFPEDPKLASFTARFSSDRFDPISARIIVSKAVQMRPKRPIPAIEQPTSTQNSPRPQRQEQSPRPQFVRATASPKRPFGLDEEELNPPKRVARGVSPLKGAAGRRLDQQRRNQASALHRDITFLLGILPPSHSYDTQRLNPAGMVSLLRDTPLPDYMSWKAQTGGQYRQPSQMHARQTSGDYNRPLSPYGQMGTGASAYRNSPLRPDSANTYGAAPYQPPNVGGPPTGWAAGSQYGGPRY